MTSTVDISFNNSSKIKLFIEFNWHSYLVGERMAFVLHVLRWVGVWSRPPVVHAWFTRHWSRLSLHRSLHRSLWSHLGTHSRVSLGSSHVLWSHRMLSGSHRSVAHGWSSGSVHACRSVHVLLLGVMILLVILCILSHLV